MITKIPSLTGKAVGELLARKNMTIARFLREVKARCNDRAALVGLTSGTLSEKIRRDYPIYWSAQVLPVICEVLQVAVAVSAEGWTIQQISESAA